MSIYRKFIESASGDVTNQQDRTNFGQQIETRHVHFQHYQGHNYQNNHNHQQQSSGLLKSMSRAHLGQMSPLASAISSTISSTPISKHQYKRLVESNELQTNSCNYYHQVGSSQPNIHIRQRHVNLVHLNGQPQSSLSLANIHAQQQSQQNQMNPSIKSNSSCISSNTSRPNAVFQSQELHLTKCKRPLTIANRHQRQLNMFSTNDPVLLKWMQAMRFETELECLTALQARTLAIDEHSAAALSVRNSQVAIQEMRLDSDLVLDMIDALIDSLPINFNTIDKLAMDFDEIRVRLMEQARARTTSTTATTNQTYCNQLDNLTIINCTPRKSLMSSRTLRPLDNLATQIRNLCDEMANAIRDYQENYNSYEHIDNGQIEAMLRKIKELFGIFTEISIRAECANIVRALDHDFSNWSKVSSRDNQLAKLTSNASLRPVRPYESSSGQLPLKWALIALWQLTKDDGYICRTLTEKWQSAATGCAPDDNENLHEFTKPRSAKRLDYSTKYDDNENNKPAELDGQHSLRSDYEQLFKICQNNEQFRERQQMIEQQQKASSQGALSSALRSKQPVKQVSTIELLIEIIISQPNRHERVDMMNFMQSNKLVELEELDQSVSAAFYTSNQYKVAALRILNHLCINEQAIKTILRCFSTPPPKQGQPTPENKIIKSIFGCYQTAQEHIYQNETMLHANRRLVANCRKRARRHQEVDSEEHSDYGSVPTSDSLSGTGGAGFADQMDDGDDDEGDDAVVREAIQLLIQLTTPFYKSAQGHDYYTLIGRFSIESLVRYLTNIIKSTNNRKMLLLSLSALANISFITTEPMKRFGSNRAVLEMFRASRSRSKDLELRDQAVTILANTADKNLLDIVSNGGLTFLLSCLEICPTQMSNYKMDKDKLEQDKVVENQHQDRHYHQLNQQIADNETYANQMAFKSLYQNRRSAQIDNKPRDRKPIDLGDEFLDDLDCACDNQQILPNMQLSCVSRLSVSEMAALERIHQKTAVAFARMSLDPVTTRMVLEYGGVKQMIDLCKLSHKRNHSDTVLIACLAALRKMSKVIGKEAFRNYNALDLIEIEPDRALEIYGRLYSSEV